MGFNRIYQLQYLDFQYFDQQHHQYYDLLEYLLFNKLYRPELVDFYKAIITKFGLINTKTYKKTNNMLIQTK